MSFDFKPYQDEMLFVPLGGSNEIGMNLNLYGYKGKWLMVDLGIGFADSFLPGVEILLPDIQFIAERKKDLLGLVLTHAHEDHLGAVPYLWEELRCPIYTTAFTHAVLKAKLTDEGISMKVPVTEIKPGQKTALGPFEFEMVPLTHSIPEMQAIALRTDKGVVMHTGDWKLDPDPLVGPASDEATLKRYGDEGVLAMVCDSTNVFNDGSSGSEAEVRTALTEIIQSRQNRVVVTTFASNIARIETIIRAAQSAGRRVALAGRSLRRVTTAAIESGYLQDAQPFLSEREIGDVARKDILILCTGCQGEPMAALSKIARSEHPSIRLSPNDTVIFSARKIPGNETRVAYIYNQLTQLGLEIVTAKRHAIHVSGHPARDELKRMYELVRPQIAIPTHGEARHIHEHAQFARSLGVAETVEARNGAVIQLTQGKARLVGSVQAGYVAVDGASLISTSSPILKARRRIRDDGFVGISVVLGKNNELLSRPRISSPGSMDAREDAELLEFLSEEAEAAIGRARPRETPEKIAELIRSAMRQVFRQELSKKPMLDVHVIRV